jgi:hypothetical protein
MLRTADKTLFIRAVSARSPRSRLTERPFYRTARGRMPRASYGPDTDRAAGYLQHRTRLRQRHAATFEVADSIEFFTELRHATPPAQPDALRKRCLKRPENGAEPRGRKCIELRHLQEEAGKGP